MPASEQRLLGVDSCVYWLAEKNYVKAVTGYTRAIDLDPTNPMYYGNRAIAHLRLENAGLAFQDASKSVELDPSYAKVRLQAKIWQIVPLQGLCQRPQNCSDCLPAC